MIRFSCHSENFGVRPMEETYALLRTLGYDAVDHAARSLTPQPQLIEQPLQTAETVRACAERHELALSELFLDAVQVDGVPIDPADPRAQSDPAFWQNFDAICRFAEAAGFGSIMGAPGKQQPGQSFEEGFANAAAVLQRQSIMAAEYGIAMHVEPTRVSLLQRPEDALRMASEAAPALRYTMDFLHFVVGGHPLEDSIRLLPYAGHLHIRQARPEGGKCRFEEGVIDYDAIVRELKRLGWSKDICSEFWCSEAMFEEGINPFEENLTMRCHFKALMRKYDLR